MIKQKAELLYAVGDLRIARPKRYKDVSRLKIGSLVYLVNQPIGRLIDIIGPVSRPYLVIKPMKFSRVTDVEGVEVTVGR